MFDSVSEKMSAKSAALLLTVDNRLGNILQWWLMVAGFASTLRIAMMPRDVPMAAGSTFWSYILLVVAPFASTMLALKWFGDGDLHAQPATRLAVLGRWQRVDRTEAQDHPLYGTSGIMVSLLVGMMLNVPVRVAEYLTAMPPMPIDAPHWLSVLHFAMTFDAVAFSCLYMIAFVAALRRVPLFPRLLVAIWLGDLAMQVMTAQLVAAAHAPHAVASALQNMLTGNVKKVLISMALWLPYLLLSTRVNVTFRHRVPA